MAIEAEPQELFTKTARHDHSNHAFVFGPDGRLYWNFGITIGKQHRTANR
jgi:hypothetical protein